MGKYLGSHIVFWEDQASLSPNSFIHSFIQPVIIDHLLYVSSAVSGTVTVDNKFPHIFSIIDVMSCVLKRNEVIGSDRACRLRKSNWKVVHWFI